MNTKRSRRKKDVVILEITLADFHKILSSIDGRNGRNGRRMAPPKKNLSGIFIKATGYRELVGDISNDVKIAILRTYGDRDPDPNKLQNDVDMGDFEFNDMQIIRLAERLNIVARKYKSMPKKISVKAVQKAEVVQDCIDLVEKAII